MDTMEIIDLIAMILVIIGSLNWGLVAIFNLDLVQLILGTIPWLANIVYIVVGLAGLWMIYYLVKMYKK